MRRPSSWSSAAASISMLIWLCLQEALGWENIRYEEAYSGGQFGIKAAITSEGIAAAAALHFKRPVRYIPSLAESMLMTSKRHPFTMKVKLGADANGKLTAYTNDFVVENGAYMILGIPVVVRALQMLSGSYHIPNIGALGAAWSTPTTRPAVLLEEQDHRR